MKYVTEVGACKTAAVLPTQHSPTDLETHKKFKHYRTKTDKMNKKKSGFYTLYGELYFSDQAK